MLSGINLVATIVKMRAPGMTIHEAADLRLVGAVHQHPDRGRLPGPDGNVLALLSLDRYAGTQLLHERPRRQRRCCTVNLIWIWGHPEVYILILPAFGVFSESHLDLLRQAAVRLHLDGLRNLRGHDHPRLPRVAAPLLHDGLRART
jgi:hypothetical protein